MAPTEYYVLQHGKQINIIPFCKDHFEYFNEKLANQYEFNVDLLTCGSFGFLKPLKELFGLNFDVWGGGFNLEKFTKDEKLPLDEYKTALSIQIDEPTEPNYLLCKIVAEDVDNIYTIPLIDQNTLGLLKSQVEAGKFEIGTFNSDTQSVLAISRLCCELLQVLSIIHLKNFDCKKWVADEMPERFKDILDTVILTEFQSFDQVEEEEEVEEVEEKLARLGFASDLMNFI